MSAAGDHEQDDDITLSTIAPSRQGGRGVSILVVAVSILGWFLLIVGAATPMLLLVLWYSQAPLAALLILAAIGSLLSAWEVERRLRRFSEERPTAFDWAKPREWAVLPAAIFGLALVSPIADAWWLSSTPSERWREHRPSAIALVLTMGFVEDGSTVEEFAGPANQDLLAWIESNLNVDTIISQEAAYRLLCDELTLDTCMNDGRVVHRMHEHSTNQNVRTHEAASCGLIQALQLGASTVVVVAHPLQLRRSVDRVERASAALDSDIQIVTPHIPRSDVSFSPTSDQEQARNAVSYRFWHLPAQTAQWIDRAEPPTTCIAPTN